MLTFQNIILLRQPERPRVRSVTSDSNGCSRHPGCHSFLSGEMQILTTAKAGNANNLQTTNQIMDSYKLSQLFPKPKHHCGERRDFNWG